MSEKEKQSLRYSIFDPTGNITALVESPVDESEQSAVAASIMARHAAVEQVGFVRLPDEKTAPAALKMAGGEFCANASMSAAALWAMRLGLCEGELALAVSGAEDTVAVRLKQEAEGGFSAAVRMPEAREITAIPFTWGGLCGTIPLVRMEGIDHAVLTPDCPFFALRDRPSAAEKAVRELCASLGAVCLGLMFLEGESAQRRLTPLVYVPGSRTLFWESSCASGSAAAGMLLARQSGERTELELIEPGGILRVESDPQKGETRLFGRTRLRGEYSV
jgi:diaminopimelate epimerase